MVRIVKALGTLRAVTILHDTVVVDKRCYAFVKTHRTLQHKE